MTTLSFVSIPSSYLEAVQHDSWNQAMKAELDALDQNHTHGTLWIVLQQLNPSAANGSTPSNLNLMAPWIDTKLDLWHSETGKNMGLTMRRRLHL